MSVTIRGCYDKDGNPVTVNTKQEVIYPAVPEVNAMPTPAKGAQNVANNLKQNTSPTQQPGVA